MDSDWAWRAEIFVLWSEGALLYSALCVSITAGVPPHVARTKNVYALHVLYMRAPMAAHASPSKTLADRAGLVNRQASAISAQRFCQWDNGHQRARCTHDARARCGGEKCPVRFQRRPVCAILAGKRPIYAFTASAFQSIITTPRTTVC